jgi:hypothetical protein
MLPFALFLPAGILARYKPVLLLKELRDALNAANKGTTQTNQYIAQIKNCKLQVLIMEI